MRWQRPLFIHFEVPRVEVVRRLPAGLTLDDDGGERTTVSLVALAAQGPAPAPLHRLARYAQLNLRTYVRGAHGPGLWFFDARVSAFWPVLARAFGQPYRRDGELAYDADDSGVALRARGITLRGLPAPGDAIETGGTLLERYVSYAVFPGGLPYAVRIRHAPWRTRAVEIDPDSRIELEGLGAGRPVSAQLGESTDVELVEVLPAGEPRGRMRGLVDRFALRLVRTTP